MRAPRATKNSCREGVPIGILLANCHHQRQEHCSQLRRLPILRAIDLPPDASTLDHPITWSFAVWGVDLVGPLRKVHGGFTHLLVAVDKFSKWNEASLIYNVRSEETIDFFIDIIHRFGVLNTIIPNNSTQFTSKKFLCFCNNNNI